MIFKLIVDAIISINLYKLKKIAVSCSKSRFNSLILTLKIYFNGKGPKPPCIHLFSFSLSTKSLASLSITHGDTRQALAYPVESTRSTFYIAYSDCRQASATEARSMTITEGRGGSSALKSGQRVFASAIEADFPPGC